MRVYRALVALVLTAALSATASAQRVEPPRFVGLRVGFDNQYKLGLFTPVELALRGGSEKLLGRVTVSTADPDGVQVRVTSGPVQVMPGQETRVVLYTRFGRADADLRAEFQPERGRPVVRNYPMQYQGEEGNYLAPPLDFGQDLYLVVGSAGVGLDEAVERIRREAGFRAAVVHLDGIEQLPTRWFGYEGVDGIVLATSRPEVYRPLVPGSARWKALEAWLATGGHVVLSAGSQAAEVLAPDAALSGIVPGRLDEVIPLRQTDALESYAGGTAAIPLGTGEADLIIARLTDVEGRVVVEQAGVPLVIRRTVGFGQVVFVACDLERAPISRWEDRGRFVTRLLDMDGGGEEHLEVGAIMRYGYVDLAGQLRSAMDRFRGVRMIPFSLVMGLVFVYILLIGPGDYFLLRRLRRLEWTWVTFPAIVLLVTAGAMVLAHYLKGREVRTHQVDLVDVDMASGTLRGTTWANIFSPRSDAYDLAFLPRDFDGEPVSEPEVLASWMGFPGAGLGGMSAGGAAGTPWRSSYSYSPQFDRIERMPIHVWSTKSVTARWSAETRRPPQAELRRVDDLPVGTITNPFDFPLHRCYLAYDRWVYDLGSLEPGATASIVPTSRRSELKTLLTGRRIEAAGSAGQAQQHVTPYSRASENAAYILRAMMLFRAAGGESYTGLSHRYQRFVDLSALLKTDRAVLWAEADDADRGPGAEILRDGRPLGGEESIRTTMVRMVLPVEEDPR